MDVLLMDDDQHLATRLAGRPAEAEVLDRLIAGHVCKEIAAHRAVAISTTREQISAVYSKLSVRGRAELLRKCRGLS